MRAGEDAPIDPAMHQLGAVAPDRVDQAEAAVLEAAVDDAPELIEVLRADVLEHADRNELVVVARDVAIVVQDELDLVRETLLFGALLRISDLLARNIERAHLHAVVTRHVQRQRTPAATRLHDALAAIQANLATDVIH